MQPDMQPVMQTVVVANAPFSWTTELASLAGGAELLVAADGGADNLALLGLRPRMVIGDLDSISEQSRRWLGEQAMLHLPDQEQTDLEKTLDYLLGHGQATTITVLGALGGRVDHTICNLGLLSRHARGTGLVYRDADELAVAVSGRCSLAAQPGETWSFWSFDPAVRVTINGVQWPVDRQRLDPGRRPSTSNRAVADQVQLRAEGGAVIAYRRLGPAP